jgi:hypothetical protein
VIGQDRRVDLLVEVGADLVGHARATVNSVTARSRTHVRASAVTSVSARSLRQSTSTPRSRRRSANASPLVRGAPTSVVEQQIVGSPGPSLELEIRAVNHHPSELPTSCTPNLVPTVLTGSPHAIGVLLQHWVLATSAETRRRQTCRPERSPARMTAQLDQ